MKNSKFCKLIQTMKWIGQIQRLSSLHVKKIGNQFRIWSKLEKQTKAFTAKLACSKASNLSQTDPVYEMKWLSSKVQSSNSLLEILKFLQTDPIYELNWSTSKFQSSNSWLEKLNCFESWSSLWNEFVIFKCSEEKAWKFQRFRKLILSLKWIEILQSFINQIAGSKKNQTV